MSGRSLQVPGSLSSALQRMYFGLADSFGTKLHFIPVGNPAPARPPAQVGFLHFIDHLIRGQLLQRALHALVAVMRNVHFELMRILHAEQPADHGIFSWMALIYGAGNWR